MSSVAHSDSHSLDAVLSRLEGVQRSGKGFRARCPGCGGQSRKLSVSEADEGRVLLHCFGGCTPSAVLSAMGLQLADLFPVRLSPESPEERRAWRRAAREAKWGAALDVLAHEASVVLILAKELGPVLRPEHRLRLVEAEIRIDAARVEFCAGLTLWRPRAE